MSEHTLKPCPFCGEQPTINHIEAHSHSFQINGFKMPDHPGSCVIECTCGAGLIDSDFESVSKRWNTRALLMPDIPLAKGVSFNDRLWNVLGETWNLVSFPLDEPLRAQARQQIMRLMNEISPTIDQRPIRSLIAQNDGLQTENARLLDAGKKALDAMESAKKLLKAAGLTMEGGTISAPYSDAMDSLRKALEGGAA